MNPNSPEAISSISRLSRRDFLKLALFSGLVAGGGSATVALLRVLRNPSTAPAEAPYSRSSGKGADFMSTQPAPPESHRGFEEVDLTPPAHPGESYLVSDNKGNNRLIYEGPDTEAVEERVILVRNQYGYIETYKNAQGDTVTHYCAYKAGC